MVADIGCNLLGVAFLLPLGLALGSFFELASDRWRRRESLLWPPSHCRSCGHGLRPAELIPIVSYVVQRGRCRSCAAPIGPGVPVREALSGGALAVPFALWGCLHTIRALTLGALLLLGGWMVWALVRKQR